MRDLSKAACLSVGSFAGKVLSPKKQGEITDAWLRKRFEELLPALMKREGIDLWILAAREENDDPIMLTMLPSSMTGARRLTILVFSLRNDGAVDRLSLSRYGIGSEGLFERAWNPGKEGQWEALRRLVEERNPSTIGFNTSPTLAFADGLSHGLHGQFRDALGEEWMKRTTSAEKLGVGWLETRIDDELLVYPALVEITHAIVEEAFSNRVIRPGVTTCQMVIDWMERKMDEIGVRQSRRDGVVWSVEIQAQGQSFEEGFDRKDKQREVILPGDLIHCDLGFRYLGLWTDIQQNAYVLKRGETDAPDGLKAAMADGNRLQDIVGECMAEGRTGNQVLRMVREKAIAEGITPTIYCHPIGFHGHAAGPTIGLWDQQDGVPGVGDYEIHDRTCYAIELNAKKPVPEWGGQVVRMGLEEDAAFIDGQLQWLHGRQTQFHLIG